MTIALNGLSAISARLSIPGTGVWVADVELDIGEAGIVPSGRAVLTIGTATLSGTIDDRATGRKGTRASVQILAGGGGWDRIVPAIHLHNDFGVTSTTVYTVTASAVGEVVADAPPSKLGPDFVRSAGPASRVFAGVAWHLDAAGVTHVGARLPVPLPSGASILEWDPNTRRAIIASDGILWPGTTLIDARFGTAIVRDVEQTFGASGSRAIAWCETGSERADDVPGSKLARAIGALARESVGLPFLRLHRYRVATQGIDGRVSLQSLTRGGPVPDILQTVPIAPGLTSVAQKVAPGSVALVAFVAGDPKAPLVVGFDAGNPTSIELAFDAIRVAIGSGFAPVVMATPLFANWVDSVTTAINSLAPGSAIPPTDMASTKLFTD